MKKGLSGALLVLLSVSAWAGEFSVTDAYIRGPPPGQPVPQAFMTLCNGLDRECRLVGASSPVAGRAEVHGHSHHGGTMAMRPVDVLPVPAGEQVRLAPGGYHLMLFDLQQPLRDGDVHRIHLSLEGCPDIDLKVPVQSVLKEGGEQ